jgi:hypothetical protein
MPEEDQPQINAKIANGFLIRVCSWNSRLITSGLPDCRVLMG